MITGWHRTNEEAEEFVVTEYPRSAAATRSLAPSTELGVITACFAAAWPANGNPPPDEGMEGRSVRATGRGPITRTNLAEVERRTGQIAGRDQRPLHQGRRSRGGTETLRSEGVRHRTRSSGLKGI